MTRTSSDSPGDTIVQRLRSEHAEIARGLRRLLAAPDEQALRRLRQGLARHVEQENGVLHPALAQVPRLNDALDRAQSTLATLTSLLASETTASAPRELLLALEAHVEVEEGEIFPGCEEVLTRAALVRMATDRPQAGPERPRVVREETHPQPRTRPRSPADVSSQQLTDDAVEGGRYDPARGRRYGKGEFQGDQDELLPPPSQWTPGDRG